MGSQLLCSHILCTLIFEMATYENIRVFFSLTPIHVSFNLSLTTAFSYSCSRRHPIASRIVDFYSYFITHPTSLLSSILFCIQGCKNCNRQTQQNIPFLPSLQEIQTPSVTAPVENTLTFISNSPVAIQTISVFNALLWNYVIASLL